MENIKVFEVASTANGVVNYVKLDIELRALGAANYVESYPLKGKIHIALSDEVDATELGVITAIVTNHDGAIAETEPEVIQERTQKFNDMVQMAIYHPLLDRIITNKYLASIDNLKNAFLTDGTKENIIARISADMADTNGEFHAYLNTVVVNEGGVDITTGMYLIGKIQEI